MLKDEYPVAKAPKVEVETFELMSCLKATGPNGGRVSVQPAVAKQNKSIRIDGSWMRVITWECGCEDTIQEEKDIPYLLMRIPCCKEHDDEANLPRM